MRKNLILSTIIPGFFMFGLLAGAANADPKTERTFKAKCASCHGADGKAQTEQGKKLKIPDMTTAAWQAKTSDARLNEVLAGAKIKDATGKEVEHFKAKFTPDEQKAMAAHIRSLKK